MSTTVHHTSDTHSNKNTNIKSQKQASDTAFRSGSDTSSISAYSESTSFGEAANTSTTASIKHDLIERVTNPTVSSKSDDGEDVTKSDEAATSNSKSGDGEDAANKSDEAATSKSKTGDGENATKSGDSPTFLFQGSPQVVKTSGVFQQVHTIYKIPGEAITNPLSNQSMYTSDIMRREVMTKYIPLSGISYAKKRANATYKEYSVPSRIVPKSKKSEVFASYIVGLWRTKCHSKPICPVVYHTKTDEIQIMGSISALNAYCVEALQSGALF